MSGEPAPDFALVSAAGVPVRLSTFWADGPALLIFYPGDDTPVCTKQLCEYRDRWADFRQAGVNLVGINPAGHDRHRRFVERHHFPFAVLADQASRCCAAYGAKAWYGTRRLAVLVDRLGTIRWRKATLPFLRPRAEVLLTAVRKFIS